MQIIHWEEKGEDGGSANETDGAKLDRAFDVWVDTSLCSIRDVALMLRQLVGQGAPAIGFPHLLYAGAFCTDLDGRREKDDPFLWHVRAQYAEPKPAAGSDPQQKSPPPDEQLATISSETEAEQEFGLTDVNGKRMVNAAGDFFDPPRPRYSGVTTLPVSRWYADVDVTELTDSVYKANDREIRTRYGSFAKHSLLLTRLGHSPRTVRGFAGVEVRMTVKYRRLPPAHQRPKEGTPFFPQTGYWIPTAVLNQGWAYLTDAGVKLTTKDAAGTMPLTQPVLLDENGKRLAANADPLWLHFQEYDTADLTWIFL